MPASAASAGWSALGPGQLGTRSEVAWHAIGPGWALADYWATKLGKDPTGPATLYLVDPLGGRYALFRWPAKSPESGWVVIDWSGDARRALLAPLFGSGRIVYQLDLPTGHITRTRLPANVDLAQYDGPDARSLVAANEPGKPDSQRVEIARYNFRGEQKRVLITGNLDQYVAFSPDGSRLAVGTGNGVDIVRSNGGLIRRLAIPGRPNLCQAVRWWNPESVLAQCQYGSAETGFFSRLWLAADSGAAPSAMSRPRTSQADSGYVDAWQLPAGLYLQGSAGCNSKSIVIAKQPPHGPPQVVKVPGSTDNVIVTATTTRLLLQQNHCGSASLAWFNPAIRQRTTVIPAQHGVFGVVAAMPYREQGAP